jgi:hypothetical protein
MVLTGCDSGGSNGGDNNNNNDDSIPLTTQTARNLLNADIKSLTDGLAKSGASSISESDLLARYNGDTDGLVIEIAGRAGSSPAQSAYSGTTLQGAVSKAASNVNDELINSQNLASEDSPNSGSKVTADDLIPFYLRKVANNNPGSFEVYTTANEVNMSQLVNKLLLGAMAYSKGTSALQSVDGLDDSDKAALNEAADYFGAPDQFDQEFLDYSPGNEGLSTNAEDVDGDGQVDFNSEFVHTWASYAAERSAVADNNGNPNDFARDFKDAVDKIRDAIENNDTSVNVDQEAEKAIKAWEKVVAVNVIHYLNSMESDLSGLDPTDEVTTKTDDPNNNLSTSATKAFNEHWGEAKPFAWALQFNPARQITDSDLQSEIHGELALGASPPYDKNRSTTVTKQDVIDSIDRIKADLQSTYNFNASNVDKW